MLAEGGWGGTTGAKPKARPKAGHTGWRPTGRPATPARLPDWNAQKAQGPERSGWGAHEAPKPRVRAPSIPGWSEDWNETAAGGVKSFDSKTMSKPKLGQEEHDAKIARRKAILDNRTDRESALASTPVKPKVERMTWHEYNLLTPRERAAIDFNTMLVKAVRKDKSSQDEYDVGAAESKSYEKLITSAFGSKDRGSDKFYAPETMAVLKQIDFHDTNSDLDDFLQLKVAITEDDLRDLNYPASNKTVHGTLVNLANEANATPEESLQAVQGQLAINTKRMEQKLADGNNMLHNMPAIAASERNFILKRLGGTANKAPGGLGYEPVNYINTPDGPKPGDMNTYFIDAFDKLAGNAAPTATKGLILGDVKETLESHGLRYGDFLDYANDRSSTAKQFGQALGEVRGVKYRSPEDFRKMLGFGEGVRE